MNRTHLASSVSNSTGSKVYYFTVDHILNLYGSYMILNTFNLFVVASVGFIGFILGLISCFLLSNRSVFNSSLAFYKFLRIYALNNALVCLITAFTFVQFTYRIFPWLNSYWSIAYIDFVFVPILTVLYFYCNFLNIAILVDRIAIYDSRFPKLPAGRTSLIGFAFCLIINLPCYFVYEPASATYPTGPHSNFTIWYSSLSSFGSSPVGKGFTYTLFVIRDFIPAVAEAGLNIISMNKMREFLKCRRQVVARITTHSGGRDISGGRAGTIVTLSKPKRSVSTDTKATILVIFMTTLSLIEHLVCIAGNLYPTFATDAGLFYLFTAANFTLAFKRVLDFVSLLIFNKNFKKLFVKFINCYY